MPLPDVIIVGGGIIGAACAAECAREGLQVTVIEAGTFGGGATGAAMGHIVMMDNSEPQFALTRYSQFLWDELKDTLPDDVEFRRRGTIWVASDLEELDVLRRKERFYRARDLEVEILDSHSLAQAEPNLRSGLAGGLLVRRDSIIDPVCAARYLMETSDRIDALQGRMATRIGQSMVTLEDGTVISAGAIVIATGAGASSLTPGAKVIPRKGQLVITDRYPEFVPHQLVEVGYSKNAHGDEKVSVAFNIQPRAKGQLLIGSSRQYGDESNDVDLVLLEKMLNRAALFMPSVAGLTALRSWTGFRAATPDGLPLIGPSPEYGNVFLATGHEGLGVTTSLATGKLVIDCILNRESAIPREPYSPARQSN
jgi:glycine/D-amino acid oxidase-like deaminating enzyme